MLDNKLKDTLPDSFVNIFTKENIIEIVHNDNSCYE